MRAAFASDVLRTLSSAFGIVSMFSLSEISEYAVTFPVAVKSPVTVTPAAEVSNFLLPALYWVYILKSLIYALNNMGRC